MSENGSEQKAASSWKSFLAGGAGGINAVIFGHPLDTIKVRLQTQPEAKTLGVKPQFTGTWDCLRLTLKHEGFFGLYKGVFAPLVGVTPLFALSFYGYSLGQRMQSDKPSSQLTVKQHFIAGSFSGIFTAMISTPGERVKCLMQIQTESSQKAKYSSSIDCAKQLYKEGGIRSIYKGTCATLIREVVMGGVYFGGYEIIMRWLVPEGKTRNDLSVPRILLSGGMAGMMGWIVSMPPDVAKTRFQIAPPGKYKGVRYVYLELIKTGGIASLFKGTTPALLRAFPANAAAFVGYEYTMKLLNYLAPNY